MRKKLYFPWVCFLITVILFTVIFLITSLTVSGEKRNKIMVSLGDSYSSGEGIEPFYDQKMSFQQKTNSDDWLAHRSEKSWPGRLTLSDASSPMSSGKDQTWFFVASSGATTKHLKGAQEKTARRRVLLGTETKTRYLNPQLDIFKSLGNNKADYVTITIGGNDAGFVEVIESAALQFKYLNPGKLEDKVNEIWRNYDNYIKTDLLQAYHDIEAAAGKQAAIIVVGYPRLLSDYGSIVLFTWTESQYINRQVELFNDEISKLVDKCYSEGMNIHFAPVIEKFRGSEAYTLDPYINEILIGSRKEDIDVLSPISAYSMHPNDKGAAVYAEAVQEVIDELEKSGSSGFQSIDISTLPSGLTDFLHQFQTFYRDGKGGKEYNYQTASTDGSNVMASIMGEGGIVNLGWYSVPYPQRYDQIYYFKDFTVNAYYEYDGPGIDWIAKNIFNLSDEDIRLLNNHGYENNLYKIDGNAEGDFDYYAPIPDGVGDPLTVVNILDAKKSGNKYQITYEVRGDGSLHSDLVGTYSAELDYKDIDGKSYWSLYVHHGDNGDAMVLYRDYLKTTHHEEYYEAGGYNEAFDINGFSVYDVNGDGIPELFAYGDAGHRRYTYLLTVIDGKITLIDATYDIEVLGSGIIKSTFNAGYGDWLITYYDVTDIGDWKIKYRYKAWNDGTYSVGEDSYEESSPKVDKSFVDAEILRIIGNTTSIDVKYWENTEANRNQVFGG